METTVRTPLQIFSLPQRLVVPLFQRPYVWDQEEQWEPLWNDVRRLTELRLRDPYPTASHFLGAVVVQASDGQLGNLQASNIIDGQQRLTTLQLMMDAAGSVLEATGLDALAGQLESLTHNQETFVPVGESRLKIRHTNRDQAAFDEVMNAEPPVDHAALPHAGSKVVRAHAFFVETVTSWLQENGDESVALRATALAGVLTGGLQLVAINLAASENSQEIFETLNARGTPLTAADLIKNYVFQRLAAEGADTRRAYADEWPFDTRFWETEVSVGRYRVSRGSLFLNQWLMSRLGEEIGPPQTFARFKGYVEHDSGRPMVDLLRVIKHQADLYQSWTEAADEKDRSLTVVEMSVYRMKANEVELLKPLLIWLHESERALPAYVVDGVVAAAESWLVRRMFLRLTTSALGRVVADLIRTHRDAPAGELVDRITGQLARLNVSSTYWPGDDEIRAALMSDAAYRRFKAARLRTLLEAVENELRRGTNQPQVPRRGYPIEHVLPQKWQDNWPVDGLDAEIERAAHVHRLGNLTLLTASLNSKVSNGDWRTKRDALRDHDTLLLNSRLLKQAGDSAWSESTIQARTRQLVDMLLAIWPVPAGHTGAVLDPRDKNEAWIEVKDLVAGGLLEPGTILTPRPGNWKSHQAVVLGSGMLEIDGQQFGSPSGAGDHVKGGVTNGWTFWRLPDGRRLGDVRAAYRGEKPKEPGWTATLPHVPWSEEELHDYAGAAAPLTTRLLDYVAKERPDELLTGADFAVIGITSEQVAGVSGAMARKTYNTYERSNPPMESIDLNGRWHYRMRSTTAATWRALRGLE
ncbi:GmrSD restriction endonuclease domain-containing protein [Nakamurella sp.]|uniref:GmrSD restriction endonuclease domain-containing protein n=1 Tax=Nakamurella sp. TaxID=1869182 RepID=UPI003B3B5867